MGKKLAKNTIESIANELNFQLLEVERISENGKYKLFVHVSDKYGYKSKMKYYDFKIGRFSPFNKRNLYVIENIKLWLTLNNKNFVFTSDEYSGNKIKASWHCFDCNEVFYSSLDNIMANYGCGVCRGFQIRNKNSFGKNCSRLLGEWSDKNKLSPFKIAPNSIKKILWKCKECNNEWMATPHQRISGNTGCPTCNLSKGERKIKQFLILNKIRHIDQKTFEKCFYKRLLKFDFYLLGYKMCIEYNGIQHYESVEHFGGKKALKEQVFKDKIKRDFCGENNIELLEIPYWEFNNIENLLGERFYD